MEYNVGYAVSNEFVPILAVSIVSLCKNIQDTDILNLYILNSDISSENKRKLSKLKKIKNFKLHYIYCDNSLFKNIVPGISIHSNYRLMIGSLIPEVDKILFLDADIVITKPLKELWTIDLKDNYIGAVIDPGVELQYKYTIADKEKFPNKRYNTGLMLVNLKKWREEDIEKKLILGAEWYSSKYKNWPDQNVMNMVFKDNILTLDYKYNCCPILKNNNFYQEDGIWEIASKDPVIIHYAGSPKVWEDPNQMFGDIFWDYAKQTPYYESIVGLWQDQKINNMRKQIMKTIDLNNNKIKQEYLNLIKNTEKKQKIIIENLINYRHNLKSYRKYRFLKNITFGETKKQYIEKSYYYKNKIDQVNKEINNGK